MEIKPTACYRATVDFMVSSPLFNVEYTPIVKDYSSYIKRDVKIDLK